ncbi:putative pre-mRNA-splicing factor ATP-dependent RNA helicase DEAH6, partial [Mucuna pruriens]
MGHGLTVTDDSLKTWVSDKLMSLLGYSQPTVVLYMIGLSKQATSPADLVGKLVELGISSTDSRAFAEEIFSRVPRKSSGVNQYQKQEREAAMLAMKQKTYTILKADDNSDDDYEDKSSVTTASSSRKHDNHKKRFRKKTEVIPTKERERHVKRRTSLDEDDDSESEEERLKDQREKEELEKHMRERDAAGTRKVLVNVQIDLV